MMAGVCREGMGRRAWVLVPLLAALMLMSAIAPAAATEATDTNRLTAFLTGAKEVPGPGDPDGRGRADIQLGEGRICFDLSWRHIAAPTAAHIHAGTRTQAGPVVVTLFDAPSGLPSTINEVGGCVRVDPSLISKIRQAPSRYYVNVHNKVYPAGAIRGQLRPAA
jgi:hypothetical protein